tara:strand:- start:2048 stop:3853 length:1806 start_codon:yes stop_codon:yes gene_type:complete
MSKDKEQKGKNAVLVIAVGKHPKMGPGERKPKGVKVKKSVLMIKESNRKKKENRKKYRDAQRDFRGEKKHAKNLARKRGEEAPQFPSHLPKTFDNSGALDDYGNPLRTPQAGKPLSERQTRMRDLRAASAARRAAEAAAWGAASERAMAQQAAEQQAAEQQAAEQQPPQPQEDVNKADEKKSKSQMRRERKAAKAAKREAKGGDAPLQQGVTKTRDEKMKREGVRRFNQMKESADPSQVREYVERRKISLKDLGEHMGVEQNDLENLNVDQEAFQAAINELAGGRAKTYQERQEAKQKFIQDASISDLANKFSLTERDSRGITAEKRPDPHPTGLSRASRQKIADMLGVNRSDIREDSPMLEGRKDDLHDAMAQLGSSAHAHRRSRGEQRSKDYHDRKESRADKKSRGGQSIHYASGYDPEVLERIAATRGISVEQLYDMITGQGGGDEEELNPRGDEADGEDSQMRNAPSSVFTTPYATREGTGFKSGSMRNPGGRNDDAGGERGSSFKPGQGVEDTMHGFKAPTSYGLARVGEYHMQPDEEQNMDEVQEMMNQKAEPMELAFRLLKESMCKGDDCDGCKNCKTCAKCKPKGSTCEKMGC